MRKKKKGLANHSSCKIWVLNNTIRNSDEHLTQLPRVPQVPHLRVNSVNKTHLCPLISLFLAAPCQRQRTQSLLLLNLSDKETVQGSAAPQDSWRSPCSSLKTTSPAILLNADSMLHSVPGIAMREPAEGLSRSVQFKSATVAKTQCLPAENKSSWNHKPRIAPSY